MKYIKLTTPFIVAIATFLYLAIPLNVFAANERIFLSPSSRRFNPGSTFKVEVRVNTGTSTRSTTNGTILYDSKILKAESVSTSGSSFGGITSIDNNYRNGQGRVWHTAIKIPAPRGSNLLVYTVTFKAVGTGKAHVWPSSDSVVNGASSIARDGVTYNISNPPPPPPPPPPPAPKPKPTPPPAPKPKPTPPPAPRPAPAPAPKPKPKPTPSPAPTAPTPDTDSRTGNENEVSKEDPLSKEEPELTISNIRTKVLYDKVDLSWEANHPSDIVLNYGTSANSLENKAEIESEEADPNDPESFPSYFTTISKLRPGTKYFYTIDAVKSSKPESKDSYQGSFTTKGYPVKIVAQQNDQPIQGATITIKDHSGSYKTDKDGASVLEIKEGTYTITVKKENSEATESITVKALSFADGGTPDTQEFKFNIIQSGKSSGSIGKILLIVTGSILALLALVGLVIFLIRKKRSSDSPYGYQSIIEPDVPAETPAPAGLEYPASYQQPYEQAAYSYPVTTEASSNEYASPAYTNSGNIDYEYPTTMTEQGYYQTQTPEQPYSNSQTDSQQYQDYTSSETSPSDPEAQYQQPETYQAAYYQQVDQEVSATPDTPQYDPYSESTNPYQETEQTSDAYADPQYSQSAIQATDETAHSNTSILDPQTYNPELNTPDQNSYQIINLEPDQSSAVNYSAEDQMAASAYQQNTANQDAYDTYAQLQSNQPPSTMQ